MTTQIEITGQIHGNLILKNAIETHDCEVKSLPFYGYTITFKTMAAAKKALRDGYKYIKSNGEVSVWFSRGFSLRYDASFAKIAS